MNLQVINSGEAGIELAALRTAQAEELTTGGTARKGWRTEKGAAPWLISFDLEEADTASVDVCVQQNIRDAQATLILIVDPAKDSRISLIPIWCTQYPQPYAISRNLDTANVLTFLDLHKPTILHITGTLGQHMNKIDYAQAKRALTQILVHWKGLFY